MSERPFEVRENDWIVLSDGTRLAARIWMPQDADADSVPAVLEILPYRRRNGTAPRDESTYPVFAAAGIAGVRVDLRGSGESDGVIDGEYTKQELSDACEVIAWIAAQPWSNGNVGMMGISWGGFNSLQVAALKPAALKAVISIASTVDRYNDDIHYKNGTHLSAQLSWAGTMQAYQSRPPDPEIVGERWREMWLDRLENEPFFLADWLAHQRRDAFWEHGSICEDFEAFPVPALVLAGWADGYRNTPMRAVEGMPSKAKALIGPWVHKYPHFAFPKPRADFHGEAIAWWNRWLRDEDNGAEATPPVRAFILDGPRPGGWRERDPGYWVAKDEWPSHEPMQLGIDDCGRLSAGTASTAGWSKIRSPLDTGIASGEWFTTAPDAQLAGDQRNDDAGSLTFETALLDDELVLLGRPKLKLRLKSDKPLANLCVRLVDVHDDGAGTRVSFGVLNLAHRDGNAEPKPLAIGEEVEIALDLDACGYRFAPGHRLRLSISSSYWPMILPPPEDATLAIELGSVSLELPLIGVHRKIDIGEPENPDPLPRYEEIQAGGAERQVERDLANGRTTYRVVEDSGLNRHPENGLAARDRREETWQISQNDPLSLVGEARWTTVTQRTGWEARTECVSTLSCSKNDWHIRVVVEAFENGEKIFGKVRETSIPRDHM